MATGRECPWELQNLESQATLKGGVYVKAVGLYRCPGDPPFACVLEGARGTYITESAYRAGQYKPDFDALPWESEYRAIKERNAAE